jgi:hypothetical protein
MLLYLTMQMWRLNLNHQLMHIGMSELRSCIVLRVVGGGSDYHPASWNNNLEKPHTASACFAVNFFVANRENLALGSLGDDDPGNVRSIASNWDLVCSLLLLLGSVVRMFGSKPFRNLQMLIF